MKDGIIKKTGNSRYLKSAIPADITHEQLVAMLIAGTFPIDLNGINLEGWQQIGDALCKKNLLDDVACDLLGISRQSVPKDAFIRLGMPTGYHAFEITVTVDRKPLPNVLIQGVKTFAGAQVYADGSGRAIGMSTSDTVTITIDGFVDLQPYTKKFSASSETVITEINVGILKKDTTRVLIDTSQTLLVSRFVDTYDLFLVGGGGSGGMLATNHTYNGVGGGGGGFTFTKKYIHNHNDKLEFSIGSGGSVHSSGYTDKDGYSGGDTTVTNLKIYKKYRASGGEGGQIGDDDKALGGDGGSGGGGVYYGGAGDGGSDGSNGGRHYGGIGQGTTTREFGETGGTLYAGAGGGVVWQENDPDDQEEGSGGAGGGADGIGGEDLSNERSAASFYGGAGGAIISYGSGSSLVTKGHQGCVVVRWRWVS